MMSAFVPEVATSTPLPVKVLLRTTGGRVGPGLCGADLGLTNVTACGYFRSAMSAAKIRRKIARRAVSRLLQYAIIGLAIVPWK